MSQSNLVPLHDAAILAGMNERTLAAYVRAGKVQAAPGPDGTLTLTKQAIDDIAVSHRKAMDAARKMSIDDLVGEVALLKTTADFLQSELAAISDKANSKSLDTTHIDELLASIRSENAVHAQTIAGLQRTVDETIGKAQTALQQDMGKMFSTVAGLSEELAATQRSHRTTEPDPAVKELEKRLAQQEAVNAELSRSMQSLLDETNQNRTNLASLAKQNQKLRASLLVALDTGSAAIDEPDVPAPSQSTAPPPPKPVEEASPKLKAAQAKVELEQQPAVSAETPVRTPVKAGIKREIEFNYLLQRMGFKRLDACSPEELDDFIVPTDADIRTFLGAYELGCPEDEVAIVNMQRGDYRMIQYHRVDKSSRNWMPNRKK